MDNIHIIRSILYLRNSTARKSSMFLQVFKVFAQCKSDTLYKTAVYLSFE